jgi:hypothetical protein
MVSTIPVPLNQWNHVALVYNGTNRMFYLNGLFAGSSTAPVIAPDTHTTASIGNVVPNDSSSFNGEIDELSIYSRALSFDEIASIYLAGAYGKCNVAPSPQLVAGGFSAISGFRLYVYGRIGETYTVQTSTNLINWLPILTFICTNSPTIVVDTAAVNFNHRFYRLAEGNLLSSITLGFGSIRPLTSNSLYLMLQGSIGPDYVIQVSSDLRTWVPITNFISTNSPVYFTIPASSSNQQQFYRALIP